MWKPLRAVGALAAIGAALAACRHQHQSAGGAGLRLEITHVVGAQPLRLDGTVYRTGAGEEFSVSRLRYYLSNFRLRREDGSWFVNPQRPDSSAGYFLVDAADADAQALELAAVPAGRYAGLEFMVGVDAARNTAGAQSGTLDPARGMFWTWNSGYIFFALDGRSPQSSDEAGAITYHVGGAREPAPARTVFLPFRPQPLSVRQGGSPEVHLYADLSRLFGGPHPLRIAALHEAMDPADAASIADGYAGMFRIDHVHESAGQVSAGQLPAAAGAPGAP